MFKIISTKVKETKGKQKIEHLYDAHLNEIIEDLVLTVRGLTRRIKIIESKLVSKD